MKQATKRLEINFSFLARYIHSYRTRETPPLFTRNVTTRLYLSMTESRICARRKYIPPLLLSFLFSKPRYVKPWIAQGLVSTRGRFSVISTYFAVHSDTSASLTVSRDSSNYQKMQDRRCSWRTLILDSYPRATVTHFSPQISIVSRTFFFFTNSLDSIGRFARYFGDGLKFPDDCPFNSFVYVTRKISETKASEEGDQDGISMSGDRLGELRQIHLSFALQTDSVDRSDRSWYFK